LSRSPYGHPQSKRSSMCLIRMKILQNSTSIHCIGVIVFFTLCGCKPQLRESVSAEPPRPKEVDKPNELAEINARLETLDRKTSYYDKINNNDSAKKKDHGDAIDVRAEIRKLENQIAAIEFEKDELEDKWSESNLTVSPHDRERALGFHERKIAILNKKILEIRLGN